MPRLASLLFLCFCLSCVLGRSTQRADVPPSLPDFFIDSRAVADLERGDILVSSLASPDGLTGEHVEHWRRCGALEAARAVYTPASAPERPLTLTILTFADPAGAFCGYTAGRGDSSRPVAELEGSFEDRTQVRAWRDTHLIDLTGDIDDALRDRARGLLRACAARLPGPLKPVIPGGGLLPENNVVPGSERIELEGVMAEVEHRALVAEVRCGEKKARAMVMQLASAEEAKAALERYQGHALDSFFEVSAFERAGASGIHVREGQHDTVIFLDDANLLGLLDAPGLAGCDEVLGEIATRASR